MSGSHTTTNPDENTGFLNIRTIINASIRLLAREEKPRETSVRIQHRICSATSLRLPRTNISDEHNADTVLADTGWPARSTIEVYCSHFSKLHIDRMNVR
jgi:hypothetical protein